MTDNEIIKALECCKSVIGGNCDACPYVCCNMYEDSVAIKDAISLINRQKAEIENYSNNTKTMSDSIYKMQKLIESQKAEIERLKQVAKIVDDTAGAKTVYIKKVSTDVKEMVGES